MSFIIGSFNIKNMSFAAMGPQRIDYGKIGEMIKSEGFDVVALQEVLNEAALKDGLIKALGDKWKYKYVESDSVSSHAKEDYAFVWNDEKLEYLGSRSFTMYRGNDYVDGGRLIRPPALARFKPKNGPFCEFRLINTHIASTKSKFTKNEYKEKNNRIREFELIAKEIYRYVLTQSYGENRPGYTFLMGDYNICLVHGTPKMDDIIAITPEGNRILRTVQTDLTSLKEYKDAEGDPFDQYDQKFEIDAWYSMNYDHFSYDLEYDDNMKITASRVEALGKYYGYDTKQYQARISDHVPIKLIVDLKKR